MADRSVISRFTEIAARWLSRVANHRSTIKAKGRTCVHVIEPANEPPELHLVEETSFKDQSGHGRNRTDPLEDAIEWLRRSARNRKDNGASGSFRLESSDKNGVVTFVKIIETTIVTDTIAAEAVDESDRQ